MFSSNVKLQWMLGAVGTIKGGIFFYVWIHSEGGSCLQAVCHGLWSSGPRGRSLQAGSI